MKSVRLTISVVVALFILLMPAFAQGPIRVTVPFEFTVGKQVLPAGDYKINVDTAGMLRVERIHGEGSAAVLTNLTGEKAKQNPAPHLIFNRYGKSSFLAEVWTASRGGQLFASPQELEYARTTPQKRTTIVASVLK